jgi:GT2 family glycosyltransferase
VTDETLYGMNPVASETSLNSPGAGFISRIDIPRPQVAIVLVNFNGAAFIEELAASLAGITYPSTHLYIVDNASKDGSQTVLPKLFPHADLQFNNRNLGLAPALNQALARCLDGRNHYVLLLNTDTAQEPDFLDRLIDAADDRTIVVPKVLNYHDRGLINTHAGGFDWRRGLFRNTHDGLPDGPETAFRREIETASFCCMLIPARIFEAIGPIDETLAMYYEDTDFVARAREAGFRLVFEPASRIYHREGGSSGGKESPFKHYYATRNRPYLISKHVSRPAYVLFSAYFLATRASKLAGYALKRDWPLLRAQWFAVRDFYTRRMGMTYEPKDFIEVPESLSREA